MSIKATLDVQIKPAPKDATVTSRYTITVSIDQGQNSGASESMTPAQVLHFVRQLEALLEHCPLEEVRRADADLHELCAHGRDHGEQ